MATRQLPDYLPGDWPEDIAIPTPEQWAQALREDAAFASLRESWGKEEPEPMSTPQSIAWGREYMRRARELLAAGEPAPPSIVDDMTRDGWEKPFIEPARPSDSFTDDLNSR